MSESPIDTIDMQLFDLNAIRDELLRQVNDVELQIEKLEIKRKRICEGKPISEEQSSK